MGYACSTCRVREFPELERLIGQLAGPCWRDVADVAEVQADAVMIAIRTGYCERHAAWLGELVGWTIRADAARRDLLAAAAAAAPRPDRGR